ncbi:MAG: hypothetical protein WD077_00365 [Bacteroidia bacterium]
MEFVTKRDDIVDNLKTIEGYLHSKNEDERKFAVNLIIEQDKILVYKVNGDNHFAPLNFIAVKNNSMAEYLENEKEDGKDPDSVITKIVGRPFFTEQIEKKFLAYASNFGKKVPNKERHYWRIKDERRKNLDLKI